MFGDKQNKTYQFRTITFFGSGRALNLGILANISSSSSAALLTLLSISNDVNYQ